ncbi:hypothetical protein H4W34_003033 [Actinomadura algeriensis]|uniref:FtsK domain-containing protein n=1 Tax=Actinomadura algeriensis TaxID=1679523 RepID=A0ABR9JRL7_9ACTN|nr:hypothetical protein [Actinomadura algeriensis]
MHDHSECCSRHVRETLCSSEGQPHPFGFAGAAVPRPKESMTQPLVTLGASGAGKSQVIGLLAAYAMAELRLDTLVVTEVAGAGLGWRGCYDLGDVLGQLRRRDPATWNLGPQLDTRCSTAQLSNFEHTGAALGTWPQGGAVIAQATVWLETAQDYLCASTSPVPVPRGVLGAPSATWTSSPCLALAPSSGRQRYERLLAIAQAIRIESLLARRDPVRVFGPPIQAPTAPPWPLRLLAACRRYGRRAEPSHRHSARDWHQPSAGSTLAVC